jgi:hypothetical protein
MSEQELELSEATLELYPPWKEALKAFEASGKSYGDMLTRDEFERWIGLKPLDGSAAMTWAEASDALRRRELTILSQFKPFRDAVLEKLQMDLVSDRAGAYIIIAPKDQPERAYRDMTTGIKRELRRGLARIRNVNAAQLTASERQALMDTMAKAADLTSRMGARKALPMDDD